MSYSLLRQATTLQNLRQAWNDVAENGGVPGVNNISIDIWRRNWQTRLNDLQSQVRRNRYKAAPLRLRRIPKKTPGQFRTLRIPTITDRVLQRAVLLTLHPLLEPMFLPCSFGYRPGRGLRDAVQAIHAHRQKGYIHVLDADIDDFFNQVDHTLLNRFLQIDLPDDSLLQLINQWLRISRPDPQQAKGLPMGGPISPLLANLYLHRLDVALTNQKFPLVRYADDFIVLTRSPTALEKATHHTAQALTQLNLRFEPTKTSTATFDEGFDFLGVHFEESWHWYLWEGKRILVPKEEPDWFFHRYGPNYE